MGITRLLRSRSNVEESIDALVSQGDSLLSDASDLTPRYLFDSYKTWIERAEAIITSSLEFDGKWTEASSLDEFRGTNSTVLLPFMIGTEQLTRDDRPIITKDIRDKLRVLKSIRGRLDIWDGQAKKGTNSGEAIFIVHGHNLAARESVRLLLSKITQRDVIVLSDQPSKGSDLLGKLLENAAKAAFAVVILSADDEGRAMGESDLQKRARQNVILELGLFVGSLGRDRVAALYEPPVEIPNDYLGVGWIKLEGESWATELAKELKAAGISVDLNAMI